MVTLFLKKQKIPLLPQDNFSQKYLYKIRDSWLLKVRNKTNQRLKLYNVLMQIRFATKRNLISSVTNSVHKFPFELSNDLKFKILEFRNITKISNFDRDM